MDYEEMDLLTELKNEAKKAMKEFVKADDDGRGEDAMYEAFVTEFVGEFPGGGLMEPDEDGNIPECSYDCVQCPLEHIEQFHLHHLEELLSTNRAFIKHYGWGFGQPHDTSDLLCRYCIYQVRKGDGRVSFRDMWKKIWAKRK